MSPCVRGRSIRPTEVDAERLGPVEWVTLVARILVLEDDRALALDLERGLSPFDCEVVIIGDGSAGLAKAVAERVDLVVVSAELRGTNGFRVCNRLKKYGSGPRVPVIITWTEASASAREEHSRLATAADAYIKKPFGASELRGQVRAHVPSLSGALSQAMPAVHVSLPPDDEPTGRRHSGMTTRVTSEPLPESPASLARFDRELAAAVKQQASMEGLRTRLTELEVENAKLLQAVEAARARAAAPPAPRPPPLPPRPADPGKERELAAIRDTVTKKDSEIVALRRELELARHAAETRARPSTAPPSSSAQRTAALTASLEEAERTIATLRGENDLAAKQTQHLQTTVDAMKADVEKVRAELAEEKKTRTAQSGRHAQALSKHKAELEAARRAGEADAHAKASTDLDARVARVAEDLAAEHAAKLAEIKKEADRHAEDLAVTIANLESAKREAIAQADREKRARTEADKARTAERATFEAERASSAKKHAETLAARAAEHETKLTELMVAQTEAQASTRALSAKLADAQAERDARIGELEALRSSTRADLSALEAKLSESSTGLATAESALADATAARTALEAEAESLRKARSDLETARAEIEKELREATATADRSEKRANELEWDLTAAQAKLAESEAVASSREAELAIEAAHARRVGELETALAAAKAEAAQAAASAAAQKSELDALRATLEERARDLEAARRAKESVNRTVVAQHASIEKMRAAQKTADVARSEAEERAKANAALLAESRIAVEAERKELERMFAEAEQMLARARAAPVETEAQAATRAAMETNVRDLTRVAEEAIARAEQTEGELAAMNNTLAEAKKQAADLEEELGRLMARAASAERARAAAEATLDIQTRSSRSAREAVAAQFDRELKRAAEAHAATEQSLREEVTRAEEALRASHAEEIARLREEALAAASGDLKAAEARFEERVADLTNQLREATVREGAARAEVHAERELRSEGEDVREILQRRIKDLETLIDRTRESLDTERSDRLRDEATAREKREELETLLAARDADLATATREGSEREEEINALEGEIAALRSELTAARTKIENETALARAANDEIEKNRKLIDRARGLLAELVDVKDKDGSGSA